jgi:hypothetical protein
MWLVRTKTRSFDVVRFCETEDEALAIARTFVGEHFPLDGCSTERIEQRYVTGRIALSRSTSFGVRQAWVIPATKDGKLIFDIA